MLASIVHRLAVLSWVASALVLAAGCAFGPSPSPAGPASDPVRPLSIAPADYAAPRGFGTTPELLQQLHSVVEGTVEDIRFDFDDCWGPRTVVTLGRARSLVGAAVPASVELYTFGGPLPGGSYVEVSELPRYVLGARYLVFLRNTDWRYSPVIGDMAYRAERIAGRDVLVSTSGRAVTGLGGQGIETATAALTAPVGQRVKGLPAALREPLGKGASSAGRRCRPADADGQGCRDGDEPGHARREVDEARRQLALTQRFAPPEPLRDASAVAVRSAIDAATLVDQVQGELARLQIRPGGRLFERPRHGCWHTTPTVGPRNRYVESLLR